MSRFRSEIHVPIKKDNLNFRDRQVKIWEDVETRMEQRRKEWETDFDKMRMDFFTLKPTERSVMGPGTGTLNRLSSSSSVYEKDHRGQKQFNIRFDVGEFKPEEVEVKVHDNKLNVYARHMEKTGTSTRNTEYSRQIDIPQDVQQDKLECTISRDGVLTISAPVTSTYPSAQQTILPIKYDIISANNNVNSPIRYDLTGSTTTTPIRYDLVSSSPNSAIRTLDLATPVKNPIVTEADGSRKLKLQCDVGEFKPDEIVVKTLDRKLIVHAAHEEKREGRTLHKEFNKEYDLPESVDSSAVVAYIGEDGKLIIEAPMKQSSPRRQSYQITQSHDVRKIVVNKESAVTITDAHNRPVVTINVHRN